jgi:hypothetical protein
MRAAKVAKAIIAHTSQAPIRLKLIVAARMLGPTTTACRLPSTMAISPLPKNRGSVDESRELCMKIFYNQ